MRCCAGDEGLALRRRPAGGDVKPPQAALAEDRRGERWGKGRLLSLSATENVAVSDDHCRWPRTLGPAGSGCVGFEPYGAEVVPWGQAHVGVKGGGQAPEQGDGGLGAALFNALDFIMFGAA